MIISITDMENYLNPSVVLIKQCTNDRGGICLLCVYVNLILTANLIIYANLFVFNQNPDITNTGEDLNKINPQNRNYNYTTII